MILRHLFDSESSTYTYLLASRSGGEALIINPVLDKVGRYLQLLDELDLHLLKAIDTHVHADHITGLGALRDRTLCITVMGEKSVVDVVSMRVVEGDAIDIEGVRLDVVYTPGHTGDLLVADEREPAFLKHAYRRGVLALDLGDQLIEAERSECVCHRPPCRLGRVTPVPAVAPQEIGQFDPRNAMSGFCQAVHADEFTICPLRDGPDRVARPRLLVDVGDDEILGCLARGVRPMTAEAHDRGIAEETECGFRVTRRERPQRETLGRQRLHWSGPWVFMPAV
jgi:hypothetical protein